MDGEPRTVYGIGGWKVTFRGNLGCPLTPMTRRASQAILSIIREWDERVVRAQGSGKFHCVTFNQVELCEHGSDISITCLQQGLL